MAVTAEKAGRHSILFRRIKSAIFLSGLSVFAQLYVFQPLLPLLCKHFRITPAQSSYAVSASTLGMATGLIFFSFKADTISRKRLMSGSLLVSSALTLLSAVMPQFEWLIALCFLKGAVLSGVSAVALAYLSEEVSPEALGLAISLYLSGNAIGGMAGRIVAILISGWLNWQWAVGTIGATSFVFGLLFMRQLPPSAHFVPQLVPAALKVRQMWQFVRNPFTVRIYCVAFLLMGSFVAVYNYLGFRLEAPPFSLPHYIIAGIFLMYTAGVTGSMMASRWSERVAPIRLVKRFIVLMLGGLSLLLAPVLAGIIIGLGLFTFSFFGANTIVSRLLSEYVSEGKSTATSLYWLFYYAGASVIGSSTGVVLAHSTWGLFVMLLMLLTLISLCLFWADRKR
ncbi:MFS transporter [Chitinophaga sp. 212800010-3]|uniref:MFS transporter n=1 Tax=unclassified Chitinophaga TaxID=2619133 RepID=UPI002DE44428|nr:Inner membrane transport protein ynfM [Chitinophaga sp. 212800010-3]